MELFFVPPASTKSLNFRAVSFLKYYRIFLPTAVVYDRRAFVRLAIENVHLLCKGKFHFMAGL